MNAGHWNKKVKTRPCSSRIAGDWTNICCWDGFYSKSKYIFIHNLCHAAPVFIHRFATKKTTFFFIFSMAMRTVSIIWWSIDPTIILFKFLTITFVFLLYSLALSLHLATFSQNKPNLRQFLLIDHRLKESETFFECVWEFFSRLIEWRLSNWIKK